MTSPYLCNRCSGDLEEIESRLVCRNCGKHIATLEGELTVFNDAVNKTHFFEKKVIEDLEPQYKDYSRDDFLEDQNLRDLWEMDKKNKFVGVTRKFWWEDHIGKVKNKRVLEVGCGVTYLIPYWLETGNELLAFDVCKESVQLAQDCCKKSGVPVGNGTFACADAITVRFAEKFDIINANNVLHHVEDRAAVFQRMGENLTEEGMLLLVEPNYYYPPRWITQTDLFDPFNPLKNYFLRNDLLEKGEKGIIFSTFKKELLEAGFKVIVNEKDPNYAGYFSVHWMKSGSPLAKAIHYLDKQVLQWILPRLLAPFEYIIAVRR